MIVKSFAKINLSLKVKGVHDDGYHELEMINLPISLHDVIEIQYSPYFPDTYITCDDLALMGMKSNLCTRAVDAMREKYHFKENFSIHIHKEIPFAAGLGGGSSNAAATMLALNKILKLNASNEELAEIGKSLGADVPFFFNLKPTKVEGIGEIFTPIKVKNKYHCLIVKPEEGLSTKEVYAKSNELGKENIDTDGVIKGLEDGDDSLIASSRGNDLYPAALALLPKVGDIVTSLKEDGFEIAAMSGSGSSCYALTTNAKKAAKAERKYEKLGYIVRLCEVLN